MKKIACLVLLAAGLLAQSCTEEVIVKEGENDPIETPPPPPPPPK